MQMLINVVFTVTKSVLFVNSQHGDHHRSTSSKYAELYICITRKLHNFFSSGQARLL
jgi:hypothetical protein